MRRSRGVLGSGVRVGLAQTGACAAELISEMEAVLRNLHDRVGRIEQILPTLATKTDLERFATKADLERLSTRTDLELSAIRTAVETSERRIRVLFEHLNGSVETLAVHLSDQMHRLSDLVERLDRGR